MELTSAVGMLLVAAAAAGPAKAGVGDERDLPEQVRALVAKVNENADPLRGSTPAEWDLIRLGLPALRHGALELIISDDQTTRIRGGSVLHGVTAQYFGRVWGRGWRDARGEAQFEQLWVELGDYVHDMPEPERRKCYERWKAWVATVQELTPARDPNRLRPPRVDLPPTTASAPRTATSTGVDGRR